MKFERAAAAIAALLAGSLVCPAQRPQSGDQTPGAQMTTPPAQAAQQRGGQKGFYRDAAFQIGWVEEVELVFGFQD